MAETYLQNLMLIGWFGGQEMLIVAAVFLLLFGGAKLPSLMRNMGRSINEFKAGMNDKPSGLDDKSSGDDEKISEEKKEREFADKD